MLSTNMRSLNANHENLYSIIDSITNPSVLILSEIWNPSESCLTINGYHPLIKNTRPFRSGGGVGIYISKNFEIFENFNLPVPLTIKTFEFTYAKVKTHKKKTHNKFNYLIISIYRPPDVKKVNKKLFLSEFKSLLKSIDETGLHTLIAGDINLNLSIKDKITTAYCDIIHQFHLVHLIFIKILDQQEQGI